MIRQFDVLDNPTAGRRELTPYIVVIQSHLLEALNTTIVAPLMRSEVVPPNQAVAIEVQFRDETFTLNLALLANIEVRLLGEVRGSLRAHDLDIHQAMNRLMVGF